MSSFKNTLSLSGILWYLCFFYMYMYITLSSRLRLLCTKSCLTLFYIMQNSPSRGSTKTKQMRSAHCQGWSNCLFRICQSGSWFLCIIMCLLTKPGWDSELWQIGGFNQELFTIVYVKNMLLTLNGKRFFIIYKAYVILLSIILSITSQFLCSCKKVNVADKVCYLSSATIFAYAGIQVPDPSTFR